ERHPDRSDAERPGPGNPAADAGVGLDAEQHGTRVHGAGALARDLPGPRDQPGGARIKSVRRYAAGRVGPEAPAAGLSAEACEEVSEGAVEAPSDSDPPDSGFHELVADRQAPDALAGRREDRVAQRGRDRRDARFTHATERRVEVSGDQVDPDLAGCLRHPRDLVRVVVVLYHASGLEADLFLGGEAHAHDAGALELRADAIGVDLRAAIDGDVHSRDRQLPLVVERRFYHRRHVGHEAVGDGDALPAALGQRLAPTGFARRGFDDAPHAAGVHGVLFRIFAMIPGIAQGPGVDTSGGADQLEQEVLGIALRRRRELADEGLDGEAVGNVRHRAEPADARMSRRLRALDADIWDHEGYVDAGHAELEGRLVLLIGVELGH